MIFLLAMACSRLYVQAQRPLLHREPYWVRAMDERRPDYFRALESYEQFWKGESIPMERFHLQTVKKRNKRIDSEPLSGLKDDQELLWLKARQFHRWSWMNRSFFDADGRLPAAKEWENLALHKRDWRNEMINAAWSPTGPNSAIMDPLPLESRVGRMVQIRFHPSNFAKVYAVSGSGGLFVSHDHGMTWDVLGTDVLPFGYQPSSVCIDYTDDQHLYLGMGDPNYGSQGHGVWKSTNGGESWFNSSGQIGDRVVYDIVMSPRDHRILIAAADEGIWYSDDSGQHWQQKISLAHDAILDIRYKPGSLDTIYACSFSNFYRSVDDGQSWQQITNGIELPAGGGRGMRIAVSEAEPSIVYLGMISNHGTVFKSMDGGTSFHLIYRDTVQQSLTTYTGIPNGSSNGQYNFSMVADPADANVVYFGTQTLWKSEDGGETWTSLYPYLYRVHPDIHDLEFSPLDHSLFNVNDGGIAMSTDGGITWAQRNDGMVIAEIYNGAQSPIRRDMMIIGTQDNGALGFRKSKWKAIAHGDVYDRFWFDYHTPDRYYSDQGHSQGLEQTLDYNLNWPFTGLGNRKMAFTPANPDVAFLCQLELWRCLNINSSNPLWEKISEPLSANNGDYIRDIVVSTTDANELFMVLSNSKILHSKNALAEEPEFDTLSAPAPSSFYQTSLVLSNAHPEILYYSSWNKLFRSMDGGKNWTELTGNLPGQNIYKIIHDDFEPHEAVYVLCANTVYYRNDSIATWVEYGQGLPGLAYVSDLQVYNDGSRNSLIRAITYGRGVFETPMYKTRALPACKFSADTTTICPDGSVVFSDLSLDADSWYWEFEGGIPSVFEGQQPPPVVYPQPGTYSVKLTVSNVNGEVHKLAEAFIQVKQGIELPFSEGFEAEFPPTGFESNALAEDNVRWNLGGLGGFSQSEHCSVFIDNPPYSGSEMKFAADLSGSNSAWLSFDIAYGKRQGNADHDSLEVLVSADCGKTFTTVYKRGGDQLATMPEIDNVLTFNPGADEWRTEHIDLSPYAGHRLVDISIQAFGGANEVIALDNLFITSGTSGVQSNSSQFSFELLPNPAKSHVMLTVSGGTDGFIYITDAKGHTALFSEFANDDGEVLLPLENLFPGTYIVTMVVGRASSSRQLIVH